MITGYVNAKLEAVIPLHLRIPAEQAHELDAVIDTGFSAYLTLPPVLVAALGLQSEATGQLLLADGSEIKTDLCTVTVEWDGQVRQVLVDVFDTEILVGMALLRGYDLNARVVSGGAVTLTRIPG